MVSGWFLFGVGELSDVKRIPVFWAISSKRIVLSSAAGSTAQSITRPLRNTLFISRDSVYQQRFNVPAVGLWARVISVLPSRSCEASCHLETNPALCG